MALDGITIHALTKELQDKLLNGRLSKIAQPEADELLLTIKAPSGNYRLLMSANAGLPLLHLTDKNKTSPLVAPNFCMLLRKHIANGRITAITQPGLERVVDFSIEHLDEMGDIRHKHLIIELMGKYSNIIFTDDKNRIIDAIKRVNASVSSVREVIPGADYFIPNTVDKKDPLTLTEEEIQDALFASALPVEKAVYQSFTGISPQIATYLCSLAELEGRKPANECSGNERLHLSRLFFELMEDVRANHFSPSLFLDCGLPIEFGVIDGLSLLYPSDTEVRSCFGPSKMLEDFYEGKATVNRIRSHSADLRQIIGNLLDRSRKKYDLQERQLKDTDKRDKYKIYGELLTAYAYQIVSGSDRAEVLNYYTGETIVIPLESDLSVQANAQKYFARYNKLKRTYEALSGLTEETAGTIAHLESIDAALDLATDYEDLVQIREEMVSFGFIRSHGNTKAKSVKSKPLHFRLPEGYDVYVGKNNIQNEELTFKIASGDDWWFHSKKFPGSHVIVKANHEELPDHVYEEAAALAAYYSKGRDQDKVEIDYVQRKFLKKVAGAAPGFVIYHTNYSMAIAPDIAGLELID